MAKRARHLSGQPVVVYRTAPMPRQSRVIHASKPGRCRVCGLDYKRGRQIALTAYGWAHADCTAPP